jgi:AcrR family transcriptional regulator
MKRDTRERILRVAAELFSEQGYDATSLRQLADRLGFTKAALYYHFQSKDEILEALVGPVLEMLDELVERLEQARSTEDWADALAWIVTQLFEKLDFFRLMDRNRHSIELMTEALKRHDHIRMHERVEKAAHAAAASPRDEIRMIAALGAVTGFDDWAPTLLAESPPEMLRAELNATIRDILKLPARRRTKATASLA